MSKTHGYESTLAGVDESLAKFGFGAYIFCSWLFIDPDRPLTTKDYIDLFLIHDPFSGTERRLATYRALLEARAAGKIHTVGVSN